MKLRELISRVEFDRIIPTLRTYDNMDGQIIHYKEAYDELRTMTPNDTEHVLTINLSERYVSVYGCGELWETCLGSEIIIGEGLTLTEEEILAHIMWEITFFGYGWIHETSYRAYPHGNPEGLDTLWELFSKYCETDFSQYDGLIFILYANDVTIFTQAEIEQFRSYFEAQKKFDKLIFRVESLPSLDDGQTHCFIVGYKNNNLRVE